jgi:hypothetical protein
MRVMKVEALRTGRSRVKPGMTNREAVLLEKVFGAKEGLLYSSQ